MSTNIEKRLADVRVPASDRPATCRLDKLSVAVELRRLFGVVPLLVKDGGRSLVRRRTGLRLDFSSGVLHSAGATGELEMEGGGGGSGDIARVRLRTAKSF
jgi:hypothetical protein